MNDKILLITSQNLVYDLMITLFYLIKDIIKVLCYQDKYRFADLLL